MTSNAPDLKRATQGDDDARRRYWSTALDEATEFMRRAVAAELIESGESTADLTTVVPSGVDVEFAGADSLNPAGMFFLRRSLVPGFVEVAREFNGIGLGVRVEFGYRTPETQAGLCRSGRVLGQVLRSTTWETRGASPEPDLVYRRLVALCANVYKTGTHLGASALDVSLIDRETGDVLDTGGPYPTLSEVTPMESPHVPVPVRRNRALIRGVFARHGFVAYPYEYWHFCAGDVFEALVRQTEEPARYGPVHVDVDSGDVTPVEDPNRTLVPKEQMLDRITELMAEPGSERSLA